MLAVKVYLQGIILHYALDIAFTHQGNAVLGGVAIHDTHPVAFPVMKDTGKQHREDGFAYASFLAGDSD